MSSSQLSRATLCPTALLLVDIQVGLNVGNGFYGTERSTPDFEANIASLLTEVRKYNRTNPEVPVVVAHVYHKSSNPNSPLYPNSSLHPGGSDFQPMARPDMASPHESIFSKTKHSAFMSTPLEECATAHHGRYHHRSLRQYNSSHGQRYRARKRWEVGRRFGCHCSIQQSRYRCRHGASSQPGQFEQRVCPGNGHKTSLGQTLWSTVVKASFSRSITY